MSNKKKLLVNTVFSILLQVTVAICGFITPKLILVAYGSKVNGLVNSVSQFISVITLLDLGVGSVVQSSLYKPLNNNDFTQISKVYVSAQKFFRRISYILLAYIGVLLIVYPIIVNKNFDFIYTDTLILAMCISNFAQYFFGVVNGLLLAADQRGYIQKIVRIFTLILNTVACVILIKVGAPIQVVKLTASLMFLFRPFVMALYVNKHYKIDRKITYDEEPIKQKWNGMAQHFAAFVLVGTDNIVLTLFSTLENVSVYAVYCMVITAIFNLYNSFVGSFFAYFGNLMAKGNKEKLNKEFSFFEWFVHSFTLIMFGCTGILITNFVSIYTKGVNDAEYIQPVFAAILATAYAMRAIRGPYNYLVLAAGHYKQTQRNYIVAMTMNIVISVAVVYWFGLVGVATGTLAAMTYQVIWIAIYDYKTFIDDSIIRFVKLVLFDLVTITIGVFCASLLKIQATSYLEWLVRAALTFAILSAVVIVMNAIFYRDKMGKAIGIVKKRLIR